MEKKEEIIKVGDVVKFQDNSIVHKKNEIVNLYGMLGLVAKIDFNGGECYYSCIYSKDSHVFFTKRNNIAPLDEWQLANIHLSDYFSEEDIKKYRGEKDDEPKQPISNALSYQVGGSHYKDKAIQPIEYITANNLNFLEGCIVKRITRHREKLGALDICKIRQECDLILQLEYKTTFEKVMENEK